MANNRIFIECTGCDEPDLFYLAKRMRDGYYGPDVNPTDWFDKHKYCGWTEDHFRLVYECPEILRYRGRACWILGREGEQSHVPEVRVNFVTRGGPHLASYRLRIALPAEELEKLGVGVVVGKFDASCDAHIFSKHWDQKGDREASRLSPCPIFDVCDDWFGREHDAYYREMSRWCRVVASSRRLAGTGDGGDGERGGLHPRAV